MRTVLLIAVLWPSVAGAQALTITAPGTYTLVADLSASSGAVVAINADAVVLNLNGKTLRCTPSIPASAVTFGVLMGARTSVTIKNGTITGCFFGVNASYSTGIVLEDVTLSGNTYIGANLAYGVSNVVRRVTCASIGGYTVEAYAICINGIGDYGLVEDSTFTNLYKQAGTTTVGEGVGLLIEQGAEYVIARRNTFTNAELKPNTIGIWSANGGSITVSNSTFTRLTKAMAGTGFTDGGGNVIAMDTTPPPTSPPPATGKWFRVCVSTTECYEGLLVPVSGGVS